MKRILYLIAIALVTPLAMFFAMLVCNNIYLAILTLLLLVFVFMPFSSFFYARKCLAEGKIRVLMSLICPLVISISYLILFAYEGETYLFAVLIFAWCLLWSLLGTIRPKKKNEDIESKN